MTRIHVISLLYACSFDVDADQTEAELQYDCRMSLSDHTGTMTSCIIGGDVLGKLIGCSVSDGREV